MKGGSSTRNGSESTTSNSNLDPVSIADQDPDAIKQEELFQSLSLRHFGKMQMSSGFIGQALGYFLIGSSWFCLLLFLYATYISKLLPDTGIILFDLIKKDHFFCYLVPLSLVPTIIVIYINWLAKNHYQQN